MSSSKHLNPSTGRDSDSSTLIWRFFWLVAFLALAAVMAALAYVQSRDFFSTYSLTQMQGLALSTPKPGAPALPGQTAVAPETEMLLSSAPTPQPWDGASQVTVLVMGIDYGDWAEDRDGPARTDTMILFSLDPLTLTAGMLNIPRDLWVNIPGYGYGKINTAYYLGEANQLPGGGTGLAVKTVEQFLGVPINYYAQIDFSAFERFIDLIGGIELNIEHEIKIDPIGPGNTIVMDPGAWDLDGPMALAYARARYTDGGDFDRATRQQEVVLAIFRQLTHPDVLPTIFGRAPEIYAEVAPGIHTNMSFDEAVRLAWLVKQMDYTTIRRGAIAPPEAVGFAKSPDGTQDILKPVPDKIRELRDKILGGPKAFTPSLQGDDLAALMRSEAARLVVVNSTLTEGLAGRTQTYLQSLGATVVGASNGQLASSTRIIDYTGNPYTMRYLVDLMKISPYQIVYKYNPTSEVDVEIILGDDWAASNPMP